MTVMRDDLQNMNDARLPWVDPTLVVLDVSATANNVGDGIDAGNNGDCTKS